jgi:L-cysteate sulfo-lyase
MRLSELPRIRLINLPTPLQELPNLSKRLGGPRIFVKRDDMTGLAFGGNKGRKLEYIMADAVEAGADCVVTEAGFHSNWCTQTAAAARRLGMKVVLVKDGPRDGYDPAEYDGNHLLHSLMGAEMAIVRPEKRKAAIDAVMDRLRAEGHNPYYALLGGSNAIGAAAYANCVLEILSQSVEMGVKMDYLIHASGSGGTQAGLIAGAKALNTGMKIIGVGTGSTPKATQREKVSRILKSTLELLEVDGKVSDDDIIVFDEYGGGGYGFATEEKAEAVKLPAETEGLFLDPVYTATAMAGLIDLCRKGYFSPEDNVVFLHTGGTAGLFPYRAPLRAHVQGNAMPWKIPEWSPKAA